MLPPTVVHPGQSPAHVASPAHPAPPAPYKLVLANGAFKSGSTWLREIALQLRPFGRVPERYARRSLRHWVCETRITALLEDREVAGPILSKSHIFFPPLARQILTHENVRVLNIQRDLRDAVVSSYYYFMQRRGVRLSFSSYYRIFGRIKAAELCAYHRVWARPDPKILTLRFEDLKREFAPTVERLAAFLGLTVDPAAVDRIQTETSLARLREKRGEEQQVETRRFFRRGTIGDWENHFSPAQLCDLESIQQHGLGGTMRLLYWALNPVRRSAIRTIRRLRFD